MSTTFYDKREESYKKRLNQLTKDMPGYVKDFIYAIYASKASGTAVGYASDLSLFLHFIVLTDEKYIGTDEKDLPVEAMEAIKPKDIDAFIFYLKDKDRIKTGISRDRKLSNKDATINRKIATLRKFFDYCINNDIIKTYKNPAKAVEHADKEVKDKKPKVLNKSERLALIKSVESGKSTIRNRYGENTELTKKELDSWEKLGIRDRAIIYLLLSTGMRVSELVGLDLGDIDDVNEIDSTDGLCHHGLTIIRKGGTKDTIYCNDTAYGFIQEYLCDAEKGRAALLAGYNPDEKALFISQKHVRLSVAGVERLVKKYAKISIDNPNLDVHAHSLRGTYASMIVNEDPAHDVFAAKTILGHSSSSVTEKYYIAEDEAIKQSFGDKPIE